MIGLKNRTRQCTWGIAVFLIVLLVAWGPCFAAGDGESAGPVRTAAEIDYPPFSFVDEQGRVNGFSVELMRAALTAMGKESTFRTGLWAEVRSWLEEGAIDALPLVGRTPEREPLFDFTFPYMTLHGAIVVRDETEDIGNLDDLKGRTVAVMQGDNAEEFLRREERGIRIHTTATFEQALQELAAGRHDAVIVQRLVALRLIHEGNFNNLRIINRPVEAFRQDFCFAVRTGDRTTLALLNEGLALVIADGTYRRLHAKWFATLELPTRRLVIGGDENFPPYEYLDEHGRPAGYNVDLTRAIAREVGLDIEIRLGPWARIQEDLARGEIDAIQGMFYSPERDRRFDFTAPHTVNHIVGVVRRGEGGAPATLADMAGKRIVVQDGDIMHEFVRANGLDSQLTVVSTKEVALRQLSEGQHDVALVSRLTAHYWIEKNGWYQLQVGHIAFLSPDYCFAVPLNHKALLAQLGEGLKVLEQTGEYRRIYEKWLGVYSEDPPSLRAILRYVAMVAGPLLALLTVFFFWSWSLRKQVGQRTAELRESEKQYRLLADTTLDLIWTMDLEFRFTYVNPAIHTLTGYTREEWTGSRLADHCDEKSYNLIVRAVDAGITRGRQASGFIFEAALLKKSGEPVWVEVHGRGIYGNDGQPLALQGTTRDITERKLSEEEREKLQNQLLQAQKMESIGRLAGGVAHDFNNMLSVIIGYTELIMESVDPHDPLQKDLGEILAAAQHSADITRQLLTFARKQNIAPRVLDLNETVSGTLKMLRRLIGEDIELIWLPGDHVWPVQMDPSQVDQILANLCVNARDAIEGVGKVTMETGNVIFDAAYCADHDGFFPGEYVLLAVSDDGCGMDKDTLDNVFEPFFTTKEVGKGTGLGLATVYGIVKQNNGFINIYSEPQQGTTIRIYISRCDEPSEKRVTVSGSGMPTGHGETILVVEDEEANLLLIVRMLEILGYTVLDASSPQRALALAEKHGNDIALLLTDVVMPKMNGRDLSARLQSGRPELQTLFMSGYTANVIAHHGVLDKDVHFIQKPFSKADLAVKVHSILADRTDMQRENMQVG